LTDPRADFPLPDTEWPLTREFWAAAEREELVIPRCAGCERFVWYPAEACPTCEGELTWTRVAGRGTLFSWAVVERALFKPFRDKAPYVTGLVALDEDPSVRIVTTIVDCTVEALTMDMPMQVVFRPLSFPDVTRSVMAPMFAPVG